VLGALRRLFSYDAWANREALASLRAAPEASRPRPLRILAHVIGAESLWLDRLHRRPAALGVWPTLDLDGCDSSLTALAAEWTAFLGALTPADLAEAVAYVNTKGESWTSTVEDILTHVVIHSAYHRGQVASELRAAGGIPAYTDFIHCVRQGLVE
jgi:uncharacterized damage-inducible protein DinB